MKELRITVDNELLEKIRSEASRRNTSVKDVIIEILKQYFSKGFDLESVVKTKIITVKVPTICLNCKRRIHNETGLWLKGIGVICKHCLLQHVKDKFSDRDYRKLMLRLEVELERLKALKSELQKEVKEYIRKYYVLSYQVDVAIPLMKKLNETLNMLNSLIMHLASMKHEELAYQVSKIIDSLETIRQEVVKMGIPKTWIEKFAKDIGISKEELAKIQKEALKIQIK